MKFKFIALFLLLASFEAFGATTYVDPSCPNNGDGTGQACAATGGGAGAFNTWASQTVWTGNAKAYQKAGTTFTGACGFLVNASGADTNNRIEIGSYGGSDKAVMNCTSGSYIFGWTTRSYITVSNMEFSNSSAHCLYFSGGTGNIVTDNVFRSCASYGISLDGAGAAHQHDSLQISNNEFIYTGNSAILADITTTNTATWTGLSIFTNTFRQGVVSSNSNPVVGIRQTTTPIQNTVRDVNIYNNTFEGVNYTDTTPTSVIWVGRSSLPTTPADQSLCAPDNKIIGIKIYNNIFKQVGGNPIYVNNVITNSSYPDALIYDNDMRDIRGNAGIIAFYSTGLKTYNNRIDNIKPLSSSLFIDGIGIDYDVCNVGGEISRNYITRTLGDLSTTNSGQGIAIFGSNSVKIRSNVITDSRIGIHLGNDILAAAGIANDFEGNTIVRTATDCVQGDFTVEQVNNFRNNSLNYCGDYGFDLAGTGQQVLTSNGIFNTTSGAINSNNDDTTKVPSNPLFVDFTRTSSVGGFKLLPNSPLCRAGYPLGPIKDYWNRPIDILDPSIGAMDCNAEYNLDISTTRTDILTRE